MTDGTRSMLEDFYRSMWQFTARAPDNTLRDVSNAAAHIIRFRWRHFEFSSRPHMVMSEGLGYWSSYLARLYIIGDRYTQACQEYDEITTTVDEKSEQGGGSINSGYVAAQYGQQDRIRLEIETFYVSAKLLLERIAVTFGFFFNRRIEGRGSAHNILTDHFKTWSSAITGGQKTPGRLHDLMKLLRRRVVISRNIHIEHPPTVGVRQWTTPWISPTGMRYIAIDYVSDDSTQYTIQSTVAGYTEYPPDIVALVEEYIGEMLTYFDTYRHASIFAPQSGPRPITQCHPFL